MNKPVIPWNPFGIRPLPRRFPVPRPHAKKRKKVIPWKSEEWHVLKGDKVEIMAGKDKGKQGTIREVARSKNWKHKYMQPYRDFQGGFFPIELPLHAADVKLVDPNTGSTTDIVWRFTESGKRVRVSLESGKVIPKPIFERQDFKSRDAVPVYEQDTKPEDASKDTYIPSLLLFHEEIMKTHNVQPTIPKTEAEPRDLIMENIRKDAEKDLSVIEAGVQEPPFYMTLFMFMRNLAGNLKFWK
eukprot:gene6418-11859_t